MDGIAEVGCIAQVLHLTGTMPLSLAIIFIYDVAARQLRNLRFFANVDLSNLCEKIKVLGSCGSPAYVRVSSSSLPACSEDKNIIYLNLIA